MKNRIVKFAAVAASASLLVLGGCSNTRSDEGAVACGAVTARHLDAAVTQAKRSLSVRACQRHFHSYFDELLTVAKEDQPGAHNESVFAEFITWSEQAGILSTRQSRELYVSYFRPTFASTPTQYSVCSAVRSGAPLEADMQRELALKQRGLMEVLNDQSAYARAQRVLRDMGTTYEALTDICGAV